MDLITYVKDINAMYAEGSAIASGDNTPLKKLFSVTDVGLEFNVNKIPVNRTAGGESICLCRGVSRELIGLSTSIEILGECVNNEYIFDTIEHQLTYERIYQPEGKPYMMGVFV